MPTHPSLLERKIIHFDMDAFYASIEIRDDPSLKDKPVVVGGSPNSRAVVCTASYEARKYGIKSAMACSRAARLCPEAIFLRPDFEKYRAVSQQIREIFRRYTSLIEPLSLDEAYLDVTDNDRGLYAVKIAKMIQDDIRREIGLTGSAGVAPNKLVAKIASDIRKPAGLTVVVPEKVTDFMQDLPLRKIHGIGPVTEKRLLEAGLKTCRDVWARSRDELTAALGENMAPWLYDRARGVDDRPVETSWVRKSLGQEETFAVDILDIDSLKVELHSLSRDVAVELKRRRLKGRTITLKVKYADFQQITRQKTRPDVTDAEGVILETVTELLERSEAGRRKIRLLGVSMSNLEAQDA